jgi:gliding motility-associated-like protein
LAQWQPAADCVTPKSTTTLIRVSGNIAYKLYGIDQNGCTAVDSVRVKVFPFPKTGFIVPLTCSGSDPVLTDTTTISSGKIVTSEWKSASLDTFNAKSITLLMGAASYKKVTLIEVSDIGCSDTLTKIVSVKANPHAAFTVKYVCLGDSSRFIPQCFVDSGKITSYSWDFSGGQTSGLSAPAFKFSSAKDYRVLLSIKTNWSCSDTISAVARVFPNPKAAFTVADVCAKDSLRFINGSNLKGDTLLTYNWNLGGLGLAKNTNPSVYVKNAGNYPGKLLVTTIHGCKDSVSATVKANPLPTAKFGLNNNCLGLSSVFTDSSSIVAGNIVAYKWQFGDGNSSLAPNPTNTYKTAGTFNVKFNVVSDAGCKDSLTKAIQIYPLAKPSFSVADLCIGENFISAAKINGTGKVVAYKWYFGNGDSAITPNINYLYKAIGVYQVQLKVITDKGCLNDSIAAIEISQKPIVAANSSNPCNDDSIIFNGSAQVTAGFVTTTVWKLSNGVTNLNKKFAAHMVPKGPISGTFYAITNKGCTDSAKTATVIQSPVVVKFSVADVCLDEVSIFKDQSLSAEPITRYAWNFGDGKGSALQNPPYTYRKDGNWNVDLLIETKPGCVYSTTQIAVVHPKPVPAFTISPNTTTIVNPNITIADISSGADTMWYEITDGYATNKRNFVHTFPDSGSFEIWQYTANRFGCLDSTHIPIVIFFTYTLHVPNVFTPNADGKNETFGPQGMGLAWYSMRIYDRWGGLVYQTEDSKPWDGSYMGETVMDGVYSVLINIRDYKRKPHYYRGTVKVLR